MESSRLKSEYSIFKRLLKPFKEPFNDWILDIGG